MRVIVVPGIGGSDSDHWQSRWEAASGELIRLEPASWDAPDFADWSRALDRAAAGERVILVAHSLGCLLAVRWARGNDVAGLFLVAVPDPAGPVFPAVAADFGADLAAPPGEPTLMIASDDDPYCSVEQSAAFARAWSADLVSVGLHGHLNSASGLGDWADGRERLTAFISGVVSPQHPLA